MSLLLACLALALDADPAVDPALLDVDPTSTLAAIGAAAPAPGFDLSEPAFAPVLADEPPPNLGKWTGAITLGASFASGNTERTSVAFTGKAEKRREKDRTSLDLLVNYAEEEVEDPVTGDTEDEVTQRRTLGTAKYDYFASKKLYYLANTSGESDLNADLELRWTVGAGVGYQFREDERWKISGETGLAWVDEDYDDPADDDTDKLDYLAGRLAYKADHKPDEKFEVGQAGEFLQSLDESEDWLARIDTHAKATLTESLIAQIQWIFTRDNTPATGAEHNDNLVLLTLGWTFDGAGRVMPGERKGFARILDQLEELYGRPAQPIPRNPFEWVLWENVAYLVDDERRTHAFRALAKDVGLSANAIAKAPRSALLAVAKLGGMHPEARAAKLADIAELALAEPRADLTHVLALSQKDARRVPKKFPSIGEPGADRILLFCSAQRALALESNGLRVALRLGYGAEAKNYATSYKSALAALAPQLPRDVAGLVRVRELLRAHGKGLCARNAPECSACPLTGRCAYFALRG